MANGTLDACRAPDVSFLPQADQVHLDARGAGRVGAHHLYVVVRRADLVAELLEVSAHEELRDEAAACAPARDAHLERLAREPQAARLVGRANAAGLRREIRHHG